MDPRLKRLRDGDYNSCQRHWRSDGSCIVTLARDGEAEPVVFGLRNPGTSREEIFDADTGQRDNA